MVNEPIVEVEHLSVDYNGRTVLNDLSFSIRKGEIVAIVGPNGSGKTTLIRAILSLIPYRGRVLVNHKPVQGALEKIGYVPQRFAFDRTIPITVREFLRVAYQKVPPRKVRRVLLEVDMVQHEQAQVGTLSGGQFQRILIARSLLNDPEVLLLDEAISEVDIRGTKSFYDIIRHLKITS